MNPLDLKTLVNFDDTTPIVQVIDLLDRLNKVYDGLVTDAEQKSKRYADALTGVLDAAKKLEGQIEALDTAEKSQQDQVAKSASMADKLVQENEAYTNSLKDVEKEILVLTQQQKALQSASDKLTQSNAAEKGSLVAVKAELKAATDQYVKMGDATDGLVKKESLKNIETLNTQLKAGEAALKAAKAGVTTVAGSYDELNAQVKAAKKELKSMEGGLEGQSKEFKDLQKFVSDGTVKLKQWDGAIGDNQRNVGDYAGALKGLKQELKDAKDQLVVIGSTLGTNSEEYKNAALKAGDLKDQISDLNEDINAVSGEPIERLTGSFGLLVNKLRTGDFKGAQTQVKQFAQASKDLTFKQAISGAGGFTKSLITMGKAILTNPLFLIAAIVIGIVVAVVKLRDHLLPVKIAMDALGKAIGFVVQAGKDFLDFIGVSNFALEDQTTKVVANAKKQIEVYTEMYDRRIALAEAEGKATLDLEKAKLRAIQINALKGIAILEKKNKTALGLTEDERADLKELTQAYEDAYQNLKIINAKTITEERKAAEEVNRIRVAAAIETQDRIAADEDRTFDRRFKALRNAEQLRNQLIRLEYEKALLDAQGVYGKQIQAQEEFNKKVLASVRKRLDDEIKLLNDADKKIRDGLKRTAEAVRALDKERLDDTIRLNTALLDIEESSLGDRIESIHQITEAQRSIIEQATTKELDDVREAGLSRIKIDRATYDAIFKNAALSTDHRLNMLKEAQDLQLSTDQAYSMDVIRIMETQTSKLDQLNKDQTKIVKENVFKVLERDAAIYAANQGQAFADAERALDEAYANGLINTRDYQKQLQKIQEDGQSLSIQSQIEYLKKRSALLKVNSQERREIEQQIGELELQLAQQNAERRLQFEQELNQRLKDLGNAVVQGAMQVIADRNEAEDADRQMRLQKLDEQEQKALQIVGDSKAAQALVEQNYAAKKKKIDDEQRQANRRRAVFEKALAITEIAINTAKGVAQALGAYPPPASFILAGVVAALGAVQIAAVASKPIPAFEKGTRSSPEGWAIVNEGGRELIVDGRTGEKRIINSDGPTMTYLTRDSKVFTADETDNMMGTDFSREAGAMGSLMVSNADNMKHVEAAINNNTKAVTEAIASQDLMQWDEKGYHEYQRQKNGRINKLNKRYTIG